MDDIRIYNSLLTGDQVARLAAHDGLSNGIQAAGDKYTGLDRFGRVVDQRWIENASNSTVDQYVYGHDRDSNVTLKIDTLNNALSESYTYDGLNRLTNTVRGGLGAATYQSWNLDSLGNMITTTNGSSNTSSTFNSQNELTSFGGSTLAFDNNGNTTTDEQGRTLTYDAWNRLLQVNDTTGAMITSYAYDGMGHRVTETPSQSNSTELYYSSQWQVVEERTDSSGLQLHALYVWSPVYVNALIVRDFDFNANSTFSITERVYALQDANYNVTSLVTRPSSFGDIDESGTTNISDYTVVASHYQKFVSGGEANGDVNHDGVVDISDLTIVGNNNNHTGNTFTWQVTERLAYDGYGKFTTTVADNTGVWHNWGDYLAWNYTFQGGRFDVKLGTIMLDNRVETVTLGRFLTADPMLYAGGGPDLYEYVGDNPINKKDPTGLRMVSIISHIVNQPGYTIPHWDLEAIRQKYFAMFGANAQGYITFAHGDQLYLDIRDDVLNGLGFDPKTGKFQGGSTAAGPNNVGGWGWTKPTPYLELSPADCNKKNWYYSGFVHIDNTQAQLASTMDYVNTKLNPDKFVKEEDDEVAASIMPAHLTADQWAQTWANTIAHEQLYHGAYGGLTWFGVADATTINHIESGTQTLGRPLVVSKPWWDDLIGKLHLS